MSFIIIVLVIVQLARMAFKAEEIKGELRDDLKVNIIHPAEHLIR